MRTPLPHPLAVLTLILIPALASASGFNLTWSPAASIGCWPENPTSTETFACNTNSGEDVAVVSFALDQDMPQFAGLAITMDLRSDSGLLPDWWQVYNAGSCRISGISISQDFTTAKLTTCQDAWGGAVLACPSSCPGPGISAYSTASPPPTFQARLRAFALYPSGYTSALQAGVEYDGLQIHIHHDHTVGSGACAGCTTPMGLFLEDVTVVDAASNQVDLQNPIANGIVFWQGEVPVAAKNITWGRIKGLYR